MKQSNHSPGAKWCGGIALLLLCLPVGCAGAEDGHPTTYQFEATPTQTAAPVDRCSVPNEGCKCSTLGEVIDCGKVKVKVDNYETCYEGSRLCGKDATWGPCLADQAIAQLMQ